MAVLCFWEQNSSESEYKRVVLPPEPIMDIMFLYVKSKFKASNRLKEIEISWVSY